MSLTPTQLSLRYLKDQGWTCQIVEVWNPFAKVRQDLFGIIDILALRGPETLGVQTTSAPNVPARVRKIAESPHIAALREAGWSITVHGWAKVAGKWSLKRDVDCS